MRINNPANFTNIETKIEKAIKEIKKPKWYQKWWGILVLSIIAGGIVAILVYILNLIKI